MRGLSHGCGCGKTIAAIINLQLRGKHGNKTRMMQTTPVDLYRVGALNKLRDADAVLYASANDTEIQVYGLPWMSDPNAPPNRPSKHVSCYATQVGASALSGKVRRLPAGSTYDDALLTVWPDYPGADHWNWSPAVDMPGSDFLNALRAVDVLFK